MESLQGNQPAPADGYQTFEAILKVICLKHNLKDLTNAVEGLFHYSEGLC